MAQLDIGNLTKVNKERNSVYEQVNATYTVFDNNGENIYRLIHMERLHMRIQKGSVNLSNLLEKQHLM